jgi:hypothetical protein
VCCKWNTWDIGDAANNEGPCPGKPDKRMQTALYIGGRGAA